MNELVWITNGSRRARVVQSSLGVWLGRGWQVDDGSTPAVEPVRGAVEAPVEVDAGVRDDGLQTLDSTGEDAADEE